MAVSWDRDEDRKDEGLGATWMLWDAILGSPCCGWGCAEGTLWSQGDSQRWEQPLGRPQAPRFHLFFWGISAETLKPCIPMEAPSISLFLGAPPAPEPGTAPLVLPTRTPWISPAPTWIPVTLSHPAPHAGDTGPERPPAQPLHSGQSCFASIQPFLPASPLFPPFPLLAKRTGKGRDFNLLPGTN